MLTPSTSTTTEGSAPATRSTCCSTSSSTRGGYRRLTTSRASTGRRTTCRSAAFRLRAACNSRETSCGSLARGAASPAGSRGGSFSGHGASRCASGSFVLPSCRRVFTSRAACRCVHARDLHACRSGHGNEDPECAARSRVTRHRPGGFVLENAGHAELRESAPGDHGPDLRRVSSGRDQGRGLQVRPVLRFGLRTTCSVSTTARELTGCSPSLCRTGRGYRRAALRRT